MVPMQPQSRYNRTPQRNWAPPEIARHTNQSLRGMAARRLVYWVLVLAPAILLTAVAIHARFSEDPYVLPLDLASQNARIAAYAGPVRATAPLLLMRSSEVDAEVVEQAARHWIGGRHEGRLLALYPSSAKNSESGVRAEVFAAKRRVTSLLIEAAKERITGGELDRAVENLLQAIEIAELSKFADFHSVTSSAAIQRRALSLLSRLSAHVEGPTRTEIAYRLRGILRQQVPLSHITSACCRTFLDAPYSADVSNSDRQVLSSLSTSIQKAHSPSKVRMTLRETFSRCTSSGAILFFSEMRQGAEGQLHFLEMLQAALVTFEPESKAILARG